jgi:hypothetical protein
VSLSRVGAGHPSSAMNKLVLLCCGALIAALVAAAPAAAAKPLKPCHTVGLAAIVDGIQKRGPSCADARVVIRSVEAHGAQCKPYRQQTIAPFRECTVIPVLSTGQRSFTCRSGFENLGNNKRWWDTTCTSPQHDRIAWRRDGNAAGG